MPPRGSRTATIDSMTTRTRPCGTTTYTAAALADTTVAGAVTAVEVSDTCSGSVEAVAGPGPAQRVSGGVLTLTNGHCSGRCSVDHRVEVPASATVRARSSSGRVTVAGWPPPTS